MLPVDLASQIITHDLQYFRKRVDFLCRMKFCRHHHKEILRRDRVKIRAQIDRHRNTNRTFGRHPVHALRVDAPDIYRHQILIDADSVRMADFLQLRDLHVAVHDAELSRRQLFSL